MDGTGRGRARLADRAGLARRLGAAAAALACTVPLAGCGLFGANITISAPSVMTVSGPASHAGTAGSHLRLAFTPPPERLVPAIATLAEIRP